MRKHAESDTTFARLKAPGAYKKELRGAIAALRAVPGEQLRPLESWLRDNGRFLLDEWEETERSVRRAPRLPGGNGVPLILHAAGKLIREERLAPQEMVRALREMYADREIRQAELQSLPAALRLSLMENAVEAVRACRREMETRRQAPAIARAFARGERNSLPADPTLLGGVLDALTEWEDAPALSRADEILRKRGSGVGEALRQAREEEEKEALSARRVTERIKSLPHTPFDAVTERLSPVSQALREDRSYTRMDGISRAYYVGLACRLAKKWNVGEAAVARAAVALAREETGAKGEAGYYLIERPDLIGEYLMKRPGPGLDRRFREGLFLAPLYLGAVLSLVAAIAMGAPWFVWPLIPLCFSEIIRRVYFGILRFRFPARLVPRLRIGKLNERTRALVVIPALLSSRKQALSLVRHLAVLRCATPDAFAEFMLLGDFADSENDLCPQDEEILSCVKEAVELLNRRYGGGFYYLHRARRFSMVQRAYTGRERKRGALESLNLLITQGACPDDFLHMSLPPEKIRGRWAYVITLDADTFLPPGALYRLVGAMEHPLQKNRIAVIQPRMEVKAALGMTRAQRLLGGPGGTDPYCLAVQDVYQDVFGRGSFVGKGIYDPALWLDRLQGRLPGGRLLSHDLIEGEIAGSALMEDVVLFDSHPSSLAGWARRLHRWTRGDWQLLPFLWDARLSLLSRHKIWDNLRRSLLPFAQAALMLAGAGLNLPGLFLLSLPFPIRGMGVRLFLLPGRAAACLDAAVRALYRQFFSRRNLLSWVTAAQGEGEKQVPPSLLLCQILFGTALTALSLSPGGFLPGVVPGLMGVISPLLAPGMDRPARLAPGMTPEMEAAARRLSRETWHFFEETVSRDTLFLPPDNLQLDPDKGLAMRTSPTNIGLYLLSCCAAGEMGLITGEAMAQRLSDALQTLEGMETWKGHFYNWYDLKTGRPLPPRFVSTVDSGNLMGCLLCCAQICRKRLGGLPDPYRDVPARLDALAGKMELEALYDAKSKLFYIGYETEKERPTPAHYDELASEARLTSFLAVMTGCVKAEHWQRLNRAAVRAGGGPVLLSWGGTLFEYLLPTLLLPSFPGTLLGESERNAVRAQLGAGDNSPFGISESGYYAFDPELNYQYRAFGLPALAKSGETAGRVIAPYASVLALPLLPRAAGENMLWMERLGWKDEYGFYEAADMTPGRLDAGVKLVKSHMAHHQGMILCALCNALCGNALVKAFMRLPAAQAHSVLLMEKAPGKAPRRWETPGQAEESGESAPARLVPRPGLPVQAHALAGGGTVWALSPLGQGYLRHGDMLATRFFPDAGEQTGPQWYIKDGETGAFIRPTLRFQALFEEGCASWRGEFCGLRFLMRLCVDPLTGAAVAALRAENSGPEEKEMEAVSFLEIAQSPRAADESHPNFRDLSVQVKPWGGHGLVSRRLPREAGEVIPLIGHWAAGDVSAVVRQGDRLGFLGRMGSYAAPAQLTGREDCPHRLGDVIAPCLSLEARFIVPPRQTASVYFFTVFSDTEEQLNALALTPQRGLEAFSLAALRARMGNRRLGVNESNLALYQQMLGGLVFRDQPHQGGYPPASRNALWKKGISGDLPVLLLRLNRLPDRALIRHALRFHLWAGEQGIKTDLAILCPEEKEYLRPCHDTAALLIALSPERDRLNRPGGVYLCEGGETEAMEMESLAFLTLRGGQKLKNQLDALRMSPSQVEGRLEKGRPVPSPALYYDNTFGGFTREGMYRVNAPAPAPWHHLVCGERFGTLLCERGILQSYALNSRLGRITRMSPDAHRGVPSEEIYLLDEEDRAWSLTACPVQYGPGIGEYLCKADTFEAEVRVFAHGQKALGARCVTIRSEKEQTLRLFWLVRFSMGEGRWETRCRAEEGRVLAQSAALPGVAFAAMEGSRTQALCQSACFGMLGMEAPPVLWQAEEGTGKIAVLNQTEAFHARESRRFTLALGYAADEGAARRDYADFMEEGASRAEREAKAFWAGRLSGLTLFSTEDALEKMLNLWLPYQVIASRLLARMGPYQAGGAFGFRDQLQDCLALLFTWPGRVRAHLLFCAGHQFLEGDVQHWWHEPRLGVRTRISDDKLFLPFITARYIQATGDEGVLAEEAPYLSSPPLGENETERYEEPAIADCAESLLFHCLRALDSVRLGVHDLPLMGGGDWNDGMNRVGGEKGESVWLGFFYAWTIQEFLPYCPEELKEKYQALRRRVLDGAEEAWRDAWYLRAWYDDGRPLGGPDTEPARIDLICQCFSALGGAPRHHARTAVKRAAEMLYDRDMGLVKLLDPPFSPGENAGYIGAYLPGVRENGGQYTHAVPWLILALCRIGEESLAWEIARAALPIFRGDTREKAMRYRIEPYVLAGDVYAGQNAGRGGWSWYTGSAAWLYYVILTALLGFEKRGNRARLAPVLPRDMEGFTLVYRFENANYHFTAARDTLFPTLDGARLEDGWADLIADGRTHEARFPVRN